MAQKTTDFVKLPMLALRGLHVFPGMLLTFDVERQASIAALNSAVRTDQMIFLSAPDVYTFLSSHSLRNMTSVLDPQSSA